MALPDEYERAALGEYSEDEEASDGESDQHDGNGVSSFEPTRSKQDPDTDITFRENSVFSNNRFSVSCKVIYQFSVFAGGRK